MGQVSAWPPAGEEAGSQRPAASPPEGLCPGSSCSPNFSAGPGRSWLGTVGVWGSREQALPTAAWREKLRHGKFRQEAAELLPRVRGTTASSLHPHPGAGPEASACLRQQSPLRVHWGTCGNAYLRTKHPPPGIHSDSTVIPAGTQGPVHPALLAVTFQLLPSLLPEGNHLCNSGCSFWTFPTPMQSHMCIPTENI